MPRKARPKSPSTSPTHDLRTRVTEDEFKLIQARAIKNMRSIAAEVRFLINCGLRGQGIALDLQERHAMGIATDKATDTPTNDPNKHLCNAK